MRVIAFHLPQFHPIPENDLWWGKGFTEWTAASRAEPLFPGHYQPRLPADLGFYDLRLPEALEAQASLARDHGIHGFCFHYFYFKGGKRLLERPLEQMLARARPDFPFCLCWANENWTRRWDGSEEQVLMPQEHDAESDLGFLESIQPYLRDPRYIHVKGRPLVVIYRASLFPDLAVTVSRWQQEQRRRNAPPLYLVAALSFDVSATAALAAGFDACCDFPPHGFSDALLPRTRWPQMPAGFSGTFFDYAEVMRVGMAKLAQSSRHLPTVALDWDNTARRRLSASITTGFSPENYHSWLAQALAHARRSLPEGERIVFINAWNEWAEGSHLEPDLRRGRACLLATQAAIAGQPFINDGASPSAPPGDTSTAETVPRALPKDVANAPGGRLRLIGIAMVGNEADIVEAFVRENCRYLDRLLIALHHALDGTREILDQLASEGLPIDVLPIEEAAYRQTHVTNDLLRRAFAAAAPDWVIPLDADEFLDAGSRAELEAELAAHSHSHACMPWVNHAPTPHDQAADHPLQRIAHRFDYPIPARDDNPFVWKLLINARLLRHYLDRYELEKGNHRLVFRGTRQPAAQPVAALANARLRHYPVRSYEQLATKVGIGSLQKRLANAADEQAGIHWAPMHQALLAGRRDADLLQMAVRQYLDTGRFSGDELRSVPLMRDPLAAHFDCRYGQLGAAAPALFLRWLEQQPN